MKRCSTGISAIRPANTTAAAVLLLMMLMLMLDSIQSATCGSWRLAWAWNGTKLDLVHG